MKLTLTLTNDGPDEAMTEALALLSGAGLLCLGKMRLEFDVVAEADRAELVSRLNAALGLRQPYVDAVLKTQHEDHIPLRGAELPLDKELRGAQ